MSFDSLGLSAELLRAVGEQGYTEATPIQRKAIPVILRGLDVMAGAQTGTGKTAGFTLPLLQRLSSGRDAVDRRARGPRPLRALVLTPTRELAAQVAESIQTYGQHLPLKSAVIFGGVKINPQIDTLRRGVDILVATPGRLLDHAGQRTLDLSKVEVLVLDEADRMLDMGFIHDIKKVLALLPPRAARQNLLFSATFSDDIKRLADQLLNSPELIEVAPRNTTAERIAQLVHPVDKHRKRALLSHMIGANDWRQVLVFTRTKHGANRLAQQLETDGLSAAAIHGNKSQGARTRALADFKSGDVRVLVATDIAARGLDIDQLPHVVNYELPNVPEDYVHRIGRTGRAGNAGEAVSLVCVDELKLLRDIERLLRREIPKQVLPGYEPDPSIRAEPILNGRGNGRGDDRALGRGRSQPQRQSESRGRGRSSAGNRSDASIATRYEATEYEQGTPRSGTQRSGSQPAGAGRTSSKPAHGHVRRTQADTRGQPKHRHPRSGNRSPRAALVGGGFKDD
jgi:ATP-dependent RNA helicase RhlE